MTLETQHSLLQSELTVSQDELTTAREDARHYSEQAVETQEIYERELVNHGKSMESLCTVREQVCGLCVCCEGVCTIGVCVCTKGCHVDCVYICCEGVFTTGGHVDCVYVVRVCVCTTWGFMLTACLNTWSCKGMGLGRNGMGYYGTELAMGNPLFPTPAEGSPGVPGDGEVGIP